MNETDRIGDLNQIVHRLCDELRAGFKIFQSEGREREAVAHQLCAVIDFLHEFDEPKKEGLTYPLHNLLNGLIHLDDGIPSPLFKFTRPRGQQAEDIFRASIRVYSAATMELLMQSGLSLQDATKQVARALNRGGLKKLQRRDPIQSSTVTSWREKLRRGAGEDSSDFWEIVKAYQPYIENPPDGLRQMLSRSLRDVLGTRLPDA